MSSPYSIPTTVDTVVLTTSLADYQPTLHDNVYNDVIMLKLANESGNKELIDGGNSIVKLLIKAKEDTGGFFKGADVLNNNQGDNTTQVEYLWQNAYEPIQITRDEERQNSGSEHKIISLAGSKLRMAELAMKDRLDKALTQPVGEAGDLIDLETLVGTGQLGTISGATQPFWQSTVVSSGNFATQGLSDMTTATYLVSSSSIMDNPTHYITNQDVFAKFEQTRLAQERISSSSTANAGFKNLTFKGVPVIYGNYVRTGIMFGLNMNYVSLAVDTATDMITTDFMSPTNQMTKVAYIMWRGNQITVNRRRNFKITDIT